MTDNNIYPIFDRMLSREDKEELLGQHSAVSYTHLTLPTKLEV